MAIKPVAIEVVDRALYRTLPEEPYKEKMEKLEWKIWELEKKIQKLAERMGTNESGAGRREP